MFISIVNNGKRPQILRQTQKWANIRTREHTRADAHINTSTLQYNLAVQSSISELEMHCAVLSGWTEHSWQQAVCLSADSSISSGWRTDRWRHCRVMSRERKKGWKRLLPLRRSSFQIEMRDSRSQMGTHDRMAICSHFSGLVLNSQRSIASKMFSFKLLWPLLIHCCWTHKTYHHLESTRKKYW